jgi:hypothetical protein
MIDGRPAYEVLGVESSAGRRNQQEWEAYRSNGDVAPPAPAAAAPAAAPAAPADPAETAPAVESQRGPFELFDQAREQYQSSFAGDDAGFDQARQDFDAARTTADQTVQQHYRNTDTLRNRSEALWRPAQAQQRETAYAASQGYTLPQMKSYQNRHFQAQSTAGAPRATPVPGATRTQSPYQPQTLWSSPSQPLGTSGQRTSGFRPRAPHRR